jgi:hypothetical protein
MRYLLALLLLTTPAWAGMDYVVDGNEVQKITKVARSAEQEALRQDLIQINAQIQSYKDNIEIQKAELVKAQALKKDIQDKIELVKDKAVIVEPVVPVIDEAIYQ